MRLGLSLPQYGHFANPGLIGTVAAEAEKLGFESLWAAERVHAPLEPKTPYPGGDGRMPEQYRQSLDPMLALTVAATATTLPRLGTSTLNAPLHPPITLARSLVGIDRLSGGRLLVGLGLSWSLDEYEAVAVPWEERGARLDETLDVLESMWAPDPVEHDGRFWKISPGTFQPKPAQAKPPIYLGGLSAPALRRTGRRADGWLGVALPVDALSRVLGTLREHARNNGRPPVATALRINGIPAGYDESATPGQLADYLHQVAELGVEDAFFDLQQSTRDVDQLLERAAKLREAYRPQERDSPDELPSR